MWAWWRGGRRRLVDGQERCLQNRRVVDGPTHAPLVVPLLIVVEEFGEHILDPELNWANNVPETSKVIIAHRGCC